MSSINIEFNYGDVYLKPKKCIVNSRSECDISVKLGNRTFKNPMILANMKSVVDENTCEYLAKNNMFYIMHRFGIEIKNFIINMKAKNLFTSISIGIQDYEIDLIQDLEDSNLFPDYITIDVAHAHSNKTKDIIKKIKAINSNAFVIAGNVASSEAVEFLQEAGADCIKLMIGPGAACTTKLKTGFTRGTISCLLECSEVAKVPLIADGGIKTCGDVAKAIACGADMVMTGSFMSGFDQNSGEVVHINGHKKYIYYGSASYNNKGHKKHIEGTEVILDYKGNMDDHIFDIECSLKSSVSYAGGKNLKDLNRVELLYLK